MLEGFKHFAIVGFGYAFIGGWILTLIVNTLVGLLLEWILHTPATDYYLGNALLIVISISLVALSILGGNRLFGQRFSSGRFSSLSLFMSATLFLVMVLLLVLPELSEIMSRYASHTQYFYHHGTELLLMLSLPLARLVLLPTLYILIGRTALRGTRNA